MEDLVLAKAGVDFFEEVFKLVYAKLYDECQAARGGKAKRYLESTPQLAILVGMDGATLGGAGPIRSLPVWSGPVLVLRVVHFDQTHHNNVRQTFRGVGCLELSRSGSWQFR